MDAFFLASEQFMISVQLAGLDTGKVVCEDDVVDEGGASRQGNVLLEPSKHATSEITATHSSSR